MIVFDDKEWPICHSCECRHAPTANCIYPELFSVPDGDVPMGERDELLELLRVEYTLRCRIDAPWQCTEVDCIFFGKPMSKVHGACKCFDDKQREHVRAVRKALGISA